VRATAGKLRVIRKMESEVNCFEMWWPGTELNRRRQPFQGCALPPELPGHVLDSQLGCRRRARRLGHANTLAESPARTSGQTLGACGTAKIIATIRDSLNAGSRRWPFAKTLCEDAEVESALRSARLLSHPTRLFHSLWKIRIGWLRTSRGSLGNLWLRRSLSLHPFPSRWIPFSPAVAAPTHR
jgi:hypothetical protein